MTIEIIDVKMIEVEAPYLENLMGQLLDYAQKFYNKKTLVIDIYYDEEWSNWRAKIFYREKTIYD